MSAQAAPANDDATGDTEESESSAEIIRQAKKRFKRCEDWESNARKLILSDIKFANADPDNGWQWPNDLRVNRETDKRPCLTINEVRQHNLQIVNDAKQNKPSVKARPAGGKASYEAAQVFEGIIRHIEYISKAQQAYDVATRFQVEGGYGVWRIVTEYLDNDTFDQEIFIRTIDDPFSVYFDPDAKEPDKSDSRFAFVFDDMTRDDFEDSYPEYKNRVPRTALNNNEGWLDEDHVRVVEYFRRTKRQDRLVHMVVPETGKVGLVRASKIPKEIMDRVIDDPSSKHRIIEETTVECFLIAGDEILERQIWPGKYIPLVPLIGEEMKIEGRLERKGHTRSMKDAQRMSNYWYSAGVEQVALQGKTPWVGSAAAISGLETYWRTANTVNHSFLPVNHKDEDGNPIPPPQRAQPPELADAYVKGMALASDKMRAVSGQYQSEMGAPSNEKSGKAINARQRQGDTATYHFIDNLGISIGMTGRILIDLIPRIYDTPDRVIKIMAEDGAEDEVSINPNSQLAYMEQRGAQGQAVRRIFNPNVGRYEVMADIGPAYASRREEAFNAYSQIIALNPALVQMIGDLMFKNADFPGAEEIAERLKRGVPLHLLGQGLPPEMQQAQAQIKSLQGLIATLTDELAKEKLRIKQDGSDRSIDAYNAETNRLKVLAAGINPQDIAAMAAKLVMDSLSTQIAGPISDTQDGATESAPAGTPGPAATLAGPHSEALRATVDAASMAGAP